MSRDFKPGDVARIELGNGVIHDVALRLPLHEGGWATGRSKYVHSVHVVNARPLVVIDPEDREQVERLTAAIADTSAVHVPWADRGPANRSRSANGVQAALRSLIAPPKPEEPLGLGAVVEDRQGEQWSRVRSHPEGRRCWQRDSDAVTPVQYRDIDAVRVLSKGVTA